MTNFMRSSGQALAVIAIFLFTSGMSTQPLQIQSSVDEAPRAVSICQAIAGRQTRPQAQPVNGEPVERNHVRFTYVTHSTYFVETAGGVTIATDYNGYIGFRDPPSVVTMNKAHSSHWTASPDPAIEYVLTGWNPEGDGPIKHSLVVGDAYVRNVSTDIRSVFSGFEKDGNSIFIFEVAGLCIGHLGHLHHELDDSHIAAIGRLDVVMVPVDGGLTIGHESMSEIVKRLRASVILPMHRRGSSIGSFLNLFGADFAHEFRNSDNLTLSLRTLPDQPTIIVLNGV
ncbi:MAG: Zn-dependent hydrolase [Rhizobiaceae bacterium MnEN-MB40S]|nr:MAG: Zn-dependent hydrolase [Rhizobiaceae bacterium MnEN-MB40S]